METIYHNSFFVIALSIIYAIVSFNFGLSTYMLNGMPIIIEAEIPAYDSLIRAAGFSFGPVIWMEPTSRAEPWHMIVRHEYQHYMQTAVLTPIGASIAYSFEQLVHGYDGNWFEIDAYNAQFKDYTLDVFYWNTKEILHIDWVW